MIIAGVYEYVLADVSFSGHESKQAPVYVEIEEHEILADFVLEQAYPNPFNPSTTISYRLSADSHIDLSIYNTSGRNIGTLFTGEQTAGRHQVIWDASGMPSGIYVVRLMAGDRMQNQKIVLMK
jgi:DNA integrity scanning protein DisA with diadenylate cyclase activity